MKNFFEKSKVVIMSILSIIGLVALIARLFQGNTGLIEGMADLDTDLNDTQDQIDGITDNLDSVVPDDLNPDGVVDYWSDL